MVAATELVELPRRRSPARAALVALRPRQWSKNLLVFAGLVFAAKLGDPLRWLEACVCFVAYCAISSASYLGNDVRDRHDDRLHPVKRSRPIARGELSPRAALTLAGSLALLALGIVASATVIAYAIYTLTAGHSRALLATVPFVVFGVFRYLLLMHRHDVGEEPEQVLLSDVPILLTVAAWVVTAAAILAFT